ncbi:MAG: aconitase X [Beijerinckiaceae bacterium]
MAVILTDTEVAMLAGNHGAAMATSMRLVSESARLLSAHHLIPVASSHIDGCLYHGDSGTLFAEHLVAQGAGVSVPTTLNVGALDLLRPAHVRMEEPARGMALRLMRAFEAMGCKQTWTCAPYQAGHRPRAGSDVAWGESNAVAFCNSVLGARTNRYGDFLDIACAITGRAPAYGLHLPENRIAQMVVRTDALSAALKNTDAFWPVLGAWLGQHAGNAVALITGLEDSATEDRMKALGAAAASTGAVALFHIAGVTPEAKNPAAVLPDAPIPAIDLTPDMVRAARALLSTATGTGIDAVAVGSPHLSISEFSAIEALLAGRRFALPFYANTGRHVLAVLEREGRLKPLTDAGLIPIADTCIAVTPILPPVHSGALMTNSGKFACYAPATTGYASVYGSLRDCIETAVAGRLVRDESTWA